MHQNRRNQQLCRFYHSPGGCRFGNNCMFVHEKRKPVCAFFLEPSGCKNGESCSFRHDYNSLGSMLLKREKYKEAYLAFKKSNDLYPGRLQTHYLLGKVCNTLSVYHGEDMWKESEENYDKVLAINGRNKGALYGRALNFYHSKNYEKAIVDLQKCMDLYPYWKNSYVRLARIYKKMKKQNLEIQTYRKALKILLEKEKSPEGLKDVHDVCTVSECYSALGNFIKTLEYHKKAIKLDPKSGLPYITRFYVRSEFNDFEGAMDDLSLYSKFISPESPYFKNNNVIEFTKTNREQMENVNSPTPEISKHLIFRKDVADDEILEASILKDRKERMKKVDVGDLTIYRALGSGAYGITYLCEIKGFYGSFVMKIFHQKNVSLEKKLEYMERDSLDIPYHRNLVTILSNSKGVTEIDLSNFPDHQKFWKGRDKVESAIVIMNFYRKTLQIYLNERIKLNTPFSNLEVCYILQGLIRGANHLNQNLVVHRDLHMFNIFVDENYGRIYIGDFGYALDLRNKKIEEEEEDEREYFKVNKTEKVLQTLYWGSYISSYGGYHAYLPPEIIDSDENSKYLDYYKSDLFSIGIIGYNLLTGFNGQKVCAPFGIEDKKEFEDGRKTMFKLRVENRKQEDYIPLDEFLTRNDIRICEYIGKLLTVDLEERIGWVDAVKEINELVLYFENKEIISIANSIDEVT